MHEQLSFVARVKVDAAAERFTFAAGKLTMELGRSFSN